MSVFGQKNRQQAIGFICDLSKKELQIIQLVGEGLSNKEIAKQIGRTPTTVKAHLARISSKVGLNGREQLTKLAVENGWVGPSHNEYFHLLSYREFQIAELICEGYSNKEIAGQLNIKADTVSTHIARILKKLDISRRVLVVPLLINPLPDR